MGGKTRIAADIGAIMRAGRHTRTTYVEPFLGGGSVAAVMAPAFATVHLSDANEDLMLLWEAARTGWVPPHQLSEELWHQLKHATEPSALRAFAGFGVSFGGAWFKSYARDNPARGDRYAQASSRAVTRYAEKIRHANIRHLDYAHAGEYVTDDAVVYCDPPYQGTDAYDAVGQFDSSRFWATAEGWSNRGARVYVTEYNAPDGWVPVWKRRVPVTINKTDNTKTATEHLFVHETALEQLRKDRAR